MRIIAGDWKRRPLRAPPGDATRPTADRVRETLFSMLVSRLGSFEGLKAADLFAGSGALGLEALSRGAESCMFVEQDAAAIKALRGNIAALNAGDRCDVRASSAFTLGKARAPLDLILLDPPYDSGAGQVAIDKMNRLGWISSATWISLETARDEELKLPDFTLDAERGVGKAKISLLRLAQD